MRYENITTGQIVEDETGRLEGQARWRKLSDPEKGNDVDVLDGDLLDEITNSEVLERLIEARTRVRVAEIEAGEEQSLPASEVIKVRSRVADELASTASDLATSISDVVREAEAALTAQQNADAARAAAEAQVAAEAKAQAEREQALADAKAKAEKEAAAQTPDKSWQNADIEQWAKDNGVDLNGATKKDDMLAAIAEHTKKDAGAQS